MAKPLDMFLERKNGSVFVLYAIILFTVVNGLLYVGIYKLLAQYSIILHLSSSLINASYNYAAAAGLSGVIFSLLTWQSYVIDVDTLPYFDIYEYE